MKKNINKANTTPIAKTLNWMRLFFYLGLSSILIALLRTNNSSTNRLPNALNDDEIARFRQDFNSDVIVIDGSCQNHIEKFGLLWLSPFQEKLITATKNSVVTSEQKAVFKQDQKENFKININCKMGLELGHRGGYVGESNQMHICFEPNFSIKDLQSILWNEYSHATIRKRNKELGCAAKNWNLLSEPFCQPDGSLDEEKYQDLIAAIDDADKNVMAFYKFHRENRTLSGANKILYKDYLRALQEYEPREYLEIMPRHEFERDIKPFLSYSENSDIFYIPAENTVFSIKPPSNLYYIDVKAEGNYIVCRGRFAENPNRSEDKASAFISDYLAMKNNLENHKEYKKLEYISPSQAAEMLSFMETFPSPVKMIFFTRVCEFLSNFFNREDYCRHQSPLST